MSTFTIFDTFSCRHCYYFKKNSLETDQKLLAILFAFWTEQNVKVEIERGGGWEGDGRE